MEQSPSTGYFWDLMRAIRGRAVLNAAILVVIPSAFVAYALLTPKVYSAVVTVAPATSDRTLGGLDSVLEQFGGLAAIAGLSGGRDSSKDEAVAVLRSRAFTQRFLDSSGAMQDILDGRFGGKSSKAFKVYKHFDTQIRSVSENRRTGLYTITIEWFDREKAASWANMLVHQLNTEMRTRAIDEAQQNLQFLNNEIAVAEQVPIREAIGRLIEAQVKQRMLATVTEQYAFRIVDPAVPAAPQEHVYPNRILFGLGGVFLAASMVVGIAVFQVRLRASRHDSGVTPIDRTIA